MICTVGKSESAVERATFEKTNSSTPGCMQPHRSVRCCRALLLNISVLRLSILIACAHSCCVQDSSPGSKKNGYVIPKGVLVALQVWQPMPLAVEAAVGDDGGSPGQRKRYRQLCSLTRTRGGQCHPQLPQPGNLSWFVSVCVCSGVPP